MSRGGRGGGGGSGLSGGFDGSGEAHDPHRLVEEAGGDIPPEQAWAVGLLRRTSPYRPPWGRKQRVRMGLAQVHRRRGRALLLRPAIAVLVLVGFGAVASAALGRWPTLVAAAYHRLLAGVSSTRAPEAARALRPAPSPSSARRVDLAPVAPAAAALPADSIAPAASPAPAEAPPVVVQMAAPPARGARRAAMSEPVRKLAPAVRESGAAARAGRVPASAFDDDTGPVIQAMRALRVEGNPVRARALLTSYLIRYPRGTLAEEALAMSIEAANVHRDGDAAALAKRYLKLYPAGHFAALARQTLLGGSAPAGN